MEGFFTVFWGTLAIKSLLNDKPTKWIGNNLLNCRQNFLITIWIPRPSTTYEKTKQNKSSYPKYQHFNVILRKIGAWNWWYYKFLNFLKDDGFCQHRKHLIYRMKSWHLHSLLLNKRWHIFFIHTYGPRVYRIRAMYFDSTIHGFKVSG